MTVAHTVATRRTRFVHQRAAISATSRQPGLDAEHQAVAAQMPGIVVGLDRQRADQEGEQQSDRQRQPSTSELLQLAIMLLTRIHGWMRKQRRYHQPAVVGARELVVPCAA